MDTTIDFVIRLLVAGVLGAVIGLEREYRAKEAGYRTHFLVSLGSALIMIVSQHGFDALLGGPGIGLDPSRIAAQVVTGIGFIGAGTIILNKQIVRGLTTAAGIWATSGIGLAIGAGMYWLGLSATLLTLVGLELLSYIFKSVGLRSLVIEFSTHSRDALSVIAASLNSKEYMLVSYSMDDRVIADTTVYDVTMVVKLRRSGSEGALLGLLNELKDISVRRIE